MFPFRDFNDIIFFIFQWLFCGRASSSSCFLFSSHQRFLKFQWFFLTIMILFMLFVSSHQRFLRCARAGSRCSFVSPQHFLLGISLSLFHFLFGTSLLLYNNKFLCTVTFLEMNTSSSAFHFHVFPALHLLFRTSEFPFSAFHFNFFILTLPFQHFTFSS